MKIFIVFNTNNISEIYHFLYFLLFFFTLSIYCFSPLMVNRDFHRLTASAFKALTRRSDTIYQRNGSRKERRSSNTVAV